MFIKRFVVIWLSVIIVLVGILAACAVPTPTPTQSPTPTATPIPTPTLKPGLAQIIAGAKKEGTVSAQLKNTVAMKSIERLKKEIKETFGVDLDIKFSPTASMDKDIAAVIMEYKAGAPPTFDLQTFSDHIVDGLEAGALEVVDWMPLITADSNPEVVLALARNPKTRGAIVNYTGHGALVYNPEKVPADKVPMTLTDLADPRWKGKVAVWSYTSLWCRRAFIIGKEKTFAALRAILKNGAIQGAYVDEYNRYLLGEVWMMMVTNSYGIDARAKGMPVAFQSIDFSEAQTFDVSVRTGAKHPNAAKLVAVYLASPAGAKFMLEEGGAGNYYYPGNYENEFRLQDTKQGLPEYSWLNYPGLLDFMGSEEEAKWMGEVGLILKTGGG